MSIKSYRIFLLAFLVPCSVLLAFSPSHAGKRALVIGVNEYKFNDEFLLKKRMPLNLEGCADDARDIRAALVNYLGFSSREIKMLINSQATLAAIKRGIASWLIQGTRPGDTVFFYFSGHGFRMHHPEGDKTLLCPHDANPFNLTQMLSARQLGQLFSGLKGRTLVAVIDSCHSASAIRGGGYIRLGRKAPRARQFPADQQYKSSGRTRDLNLFDEVYLDKIFLAACATTEKAWELPINGRTRGVFTYGFIEALKAHRGNVNAATLLKIAAGVVQHEKLPQHPVLKGKSFLAKRGFRDLFISPPEAKLAGLSDPNPPFKVETWVTQKGRTTFRLGEKISFSVKSKKSGYLYLIDVNAEKAATLLFPNYWDRDNFIPANKKITVPGKKFQSELYAAAPTGRDTVIALVSSRRWPEFESIKADSTQLMAALDKLQIQKVVAGVLTRSAFRGIKVRPKSNPAASKSDFFWAMGKINVKIID